MIWKGRLGNLHEHWNVIRDKHDLSRFGDFHEKFFLCLLFFIFLFLFQPCPPLLWGRSSCPGIHWDYLQTQFPTQHFTLQTWNGLRSLICHIFLKCRIGGEQLQLILRKTGTTDPGIHTKRKSTIKRKYPRKSTTKESIKEKNTIKSRILQTSHQSCCQETTFCQKVKI